MEDRTMYEAPEIVYEGELEVQAGTGPMGLIDLDDLMDPEGW